MKNPRNGVMCKDKWKFLNSNFKKLVDYSKAQGIILVSRT